MRNFDGVVVTANFAQMVKDQDGRLGDAGIVEAAAQVVLKAEGKVLSAPKQNAPGVYSVKSPGAMPKGSRVLCFFNDNKLVVLAYYGDHQSYEAAIDNGEVSRLKEVAVENIGKGAPTYAEVNFPQSNDVLIKEDVVKQINDDINPREIRNAIQMVEFLDDDRISQHVEVDIQVTSMVVQPDGEVELVTYTIAPKDLAKHIDDLVKQGNSPDDISIDIELEFKCENGKRFTALIEDDLGEKGSQTIKNKTIGFLGTGFADEVVLEKNMKRSGRLEPGESLGEHIFTTKEVSSLLNQFLKRNNGKQAEQDLSQGVIK